MVRRSDRRRSLAPVASSGASESTWKSEPAGFPASSIPFPFSTTSSVVRLRGGARSAQANQAREGRRPYYSLQEAVETGAQLWEE
jgi:hypothetical protein